MNRTLEQKLTQIRKYETKVNEKAWQYGLAKKQDSYLRAKPYNIRR